VDSTQPNLDTVLITNKKPTKSDTLTKCKTSSNLLQDERKSLMFFSPLSHRILDTNSSNGINFRYGSPRNF
jgi:hypothetical protein